MSWPRVLLYYVLAIVLGAHLWNVHSSRTIAEERAPATTEPFLAAVPERIDRVRAERSDAAVEFQRKDGRWTVTEPAGIASPGDIVDALLDGLVGTPPIEVVADTVERHGQYGLNPPRVRLRIEQAGEVLSTVAFGELNPTRTAVYAKKAGKDEVFLLGLNSQYYLDLIFENVRRQVASSGAVMPEPVVPADDAPAAGALLAPVVRPLGGALAPAAVPSPGGSAPSSGMSPPGGATPSSGMSPPGGATAPPGAAAPTAPLAPTQRGQDAPPAR
ncbi:MAG TPA: DUF4340 domain-containing protein [Candidatus Binatia bacterium]|nr:DUF4340 domain-containing protein [Candidatus Binatia bacterium]